MAIRIPARLTVAEGRRFGLTLGAAFAALSAVAYWRGHEIVAFVAAPLVFALVLAALVAPTSLSPIYRAWMRFGLAISRITTPILMAIIYFLILTPTGLLMRLFRYRPLRHADAGGSFWKRPHSGGRSDMNHQF